jgi:uncharacterized protein YbjT (DUF2867 family)
MTTTLVTGATGTLGIPTVNRLRAAGHDVRALSRRRGPGLTAAGVRHLVLISIVGIDDIPLAYYRDKVVIERLVRESGLPYSVLRATQFHSFVESMFTAQRRSPVVVAPRLPLQPIAVDEVADRLVELTGSAPTGRVADIGGPEQHGLADLARLWARATGTRRPVVPLSLPGKLFAAYRAGSALVPGPAYGRQTFAEHLAARSSALR